MQRHCFRQYHHDEKQFRFCLQMSVLFGQELKLSISSSSVDICKSTLKGRINNENNYMQMDWPMRLTITFLYWCYFSLYKKTQASEVSSYRLLQCIAFLCGWAHVAGWLYNCQWTEFGFVFARLSFFLLVLCFEFFWNKVLQQLLTLFFFFAACLVFPETLSTNSWEG